MNVTVKDGQLLVHCQATCPQSDVVASLRVANLWPEHEPSARQAQKREMVATYDYRGADGRLLFQAVRFFPKGFSQRRPDGHGGWIFDLKDVQPVLYRLPELLAADPRQTVYVVEGEKDADRLRAGGLVATSNAMGAGKWRASYSESLRNRQVVVLADNDAPGKEHARAVLKSLQGVAASARIVELPGLPEHGDVSDWLDMGHATSELRAACSAAPRTWNAAELLKRTLPEPRWAIPDIISEGLTVLAGRPKFGKSWVALQMALSVAYGGRALSQVQVEQGEVLYLALEDNERRLQKRLRMLVREGPLPQLLELQAEWPRLDEGGTEALEAWLDEHPRTRLVVLDTWTLIRPKPHKGSDPYFEDTNAARRLKALADSRHIAIVALHHTRKPFLGGSVSDFLDEVLGSSGLTAAADSILVLQRQRGERNGVLHLTGRDILEDSRSLEWDDETGWSLGGSAEEAALTRERRDTLEALREADAPLSPTQLAEHMGKKLNATKRLLWLMSRDAQVMNDGRGHYSAPIAADAGYLARAHGKLDNPGNPLSNGGNPVTGEDAAPVTNHSPPQDWPVTDILGSVTQSEFRVTELPGLPEISESATCHACGGRLERSEEHWPWLHNDCALPELAARGASP